MLIILSSITYSSFWLRLFHHSVGLHHAAVGEAAVIFIFFTSPKK